MLSNTELITFCNQLGMLIHSGISTMEGISIMRDDLPEGSGKALLTQIYDGLEMQQELSDVLVETGEFPKYATDMIRIGNYSGKLDEVLASLSVYYEREENIASSIRNAVTYPTIMILMLFIVIGVLIVKVLPVFQDVYRQLGTELSGPARALMTFSNGLQRALPFVIVLLLLGGGVLFILIKRKSAVFSNFFLSKKLAESIAVGRFASGMALTLSSGLDTDESLKMTSELTDHIGLQQKVSVCKEQISAGERFADAITTAGIFSSTQSRMIHIGVRSGAMDSVMEDIARQCNEETDSKIQHILSILEPTLVAILAIIVGVILLSVMLPLMGIMTQMGL